MPVWVQFLLALIPIVWLVVSLGVLSMPAPKASVIGLVITWILAVLAFKMPVFDSMTAMLEGALMGVFPIMYVILAALFTYNLTTKSGAMKVVQNMLSSVSSDKRILALVITFGFGGFLEGIAGFGTAVAIPAGILMTFGVEPIQASVVALVANSFPTAFGAIGLPVSTLAVVTHLNPILLSTVISLQEVPMIVITAFVVVAVMGGGFKAWKGMIGITLASGLAFGLTQVVISKFIGAEVPEVVGSIASIAVTVLMAKAREKNKPATAQPNVVHQSLHDILVATSPFILIFVFVILASPVVPQLEAALGQFKVSFPIYKGNDFTFAYLTSPGTLILLATIIGGFIQKMKVSDIVAVFVSTLKVLGNTTITICGLVALAKLMGYSGMITVIATTLVAILGIFYPLLAPVIGGLGTFLTGSNVNSAVLFGNLQLAAAHGLGASPTWLVGANMVGSTAGKMISPQSIAVSTAATGLDGKEGVILKKALKWEVVYLGAAAIWIFVGSLLFR